MLMQYITPDRLTFVLWCMVGKTVMMAVSDARVERYIRSVRLLSII